MAKAQTSWLSWLAVFVMLFLSFFGNNALAAASDDHHNHHVAARHNPICKAQCTTAGILPTKIDQLEQKQDKEPKLAIATLPHLDPFKFDFVQKISSTANIAELPRPPDILGLTCNYRI